MNPRAIYKLAIVLTKSQLRGYQRTRLISRILGDPRVILAANGILVASLAFLSYFLLARVLPGDVRTAVQEIEVEALAGIPTAMAFAVILFGVVVEISQPVQSMGTDLINWLPISPTEYVAGSTISLSYTYSFMLSLFLGATLGPAVLFDMVQIWFAAAVLSVISLFVGACVVEMLRALTNRISSSFYRKSGRSGIFVRLFLTIIVLVFFQLMFSGQIIVYLLQSVIQTVRAAWFVPVLWPSLAVLGLSQGSILISSTFGILSLGFLAALFLLAVNFRTRFWVPIPVSIKLTTRAYRPQGRVHTLPGMGTVESAIFRKDLRSLTRRREMARFLAIPFVLVVSLGISLVPLGGRSFPQGPGFFATIPLYLMPVAIFCAIISMTSIGQEGYAVWNLYASPIEARQLLKAKLLYVLITGLPFALGLLVILGLFLKVLVTHFLVLLSLGMVVVLEVSAFGLYFGAKFPDFRETIRSRYVTAWGSMVGVFSGLLIAMLTASPVFIASLFRPSLTDQLAVLAFALGLTVFFVGLKLAEHQTRTLLQSIRT